MGMRAESSMFFMSSDEEDDEQGYRFADHAFQPGEYVSIREDEGLRTFRVVRAEVVKA